MGQFADRPIRFLSLSELLRLFLSLIFSVFQELLGYGSLDIRIRVISPDTEEFVLFFEKHIIALQFVRDTVCRILVKTAGSITEIVVFVQDQISDKACYPDAYERKDQGRDNDH